MDLEARIAGTGGHTNRGAGVGVRRDLGIWIRIGEMHRQKNPQKSSAKRVEVLGHILSPLLRVRKNQRVGTRSQLDQGVGELTAPPTNRTEEAAAS